MMIHVSRGFLFYLHILDTGALDGYNVLLVPGAAKIATNGRPFKAHTTNLYNNLLNSISPQSRCTEPMHPIYGVGQD